MKKEIDIASEEMLRVNLFLSNGQVMLVTSCSADGSTKGIATIAWVTPTSHAPNLILASIGNGPEEAGILSYRYSYRLVKESQEFGVCVPDAGLKQQVGLAGSNHSNEVDVFKESGLTPMKSKVIKAPLIEECFFNVECQVVDEIATGDHTLFIGKIVAVHCEDDFIVDGHVNSKYLDKTNQLHCSDYFVDMGYL
jgi:flavin reductase (DIM6/NTAB) family NADH-FMN oxidoreductase RutF